MGAVSGGVHCVLFVQGELANIYAVFECTQHITKFPNGMYL